MALSRLHHALAIAAMLTLGLSLHAQRPPRKVAGSPQGKSTNRKPERDLSDVHITTRAFGLYKTLGGNPFQQVNEWRLERLQPGDQDLPRGTRPVEPGSFMDEHGKPLAVYAVHLRDYFRFEPDSTVNNCWLRVRQVPQLSTDQGQTWVDGVQVEDGWRFVMEKGFVVLQPTDESLVPARTECLAIENGRGLAKPERFHGNAYIHEWDFRSPRTSSIILAMMWGRNECQGLIKFPGTDFTAPFRGVRVGRQWLAKVVEPRPIWAGICEPSGQVQSGWSRVLEADAPWLLLDDQRVLLGYLRTMPNLAREEDMAVQFDHCFQWSRTRSVSLPSLATAVQAKWQDSFWARTDEAGTFSREADQAFAAAGLKAYLIVPVEKGPKATVADKKRVERIQASLVPHLTRLKQAGIPWVFAEPGRFGTPKL